MSAREIDETKDPWTVHSEERVYENPWIAVDHRVVTTPTGAPGFYGIVRFKKRSVGVLPIAADGRVHLVGQWRPPVDRYSWEMPEGGREAGESEEAAARRELEEEAGVRAGVLRRLFSIHPSNAITDEEVACFLAWDLSPGQTAPDETEAFSQRLIPFQAALAEVQSGRIRDVVTVVTLYAAHHMAVTGGLPAALAAAMLRV